MTSFATLAAVTDRGEREGREDQIRYTESHEDMATDLCISNEIASILPYGDDKTDTLCFSCPRKNCRKQFTQRRNCLDHYRCAHTEKQQDQKKAFECPADQCTSAFTRKTNLAKHFKLKHQVKDAECPSDLVPTILSNIPLTLMVPESSPSAAESNEPPQSVSLSSPPTTLIHRPIPIRKPPPFEEPVMQYQQQQPIAFFNSHPCGCVAIPNYGIAWICNICNHAFDSHFSVVWHIEGYHWWNPLAPQIVPLGYFNTGF